MHKKQRAWNYTNCTKGNMKGENGVLRSIEIVTQTMIW